MTRSKHDIGTIDEIRSDTEILFPVGASEEMKRTTQRKMGAHSTPFAFRRAIVDSILTAVGVDDGRQILEYVAEHATKIIGSRGSSRDRGRRLEGVACDASEYVLNHPCMPLDEALEDLCNLESSGCEELLRKYLGI